MQPHALVPFGARAATPVRVASVAVQSSHPLHIHPLMRASTGGVFGSEGLETALCHTRSNSVAPPTYPTVSAPLLCAASRNQSGSNQCVASFGGGQ